MFGTCGKTQWIGHMLTLFYDVQQQIARLIGTHKLKNAGIPSINKLRVV
jgi:hypothetical protein